MSPKLLTNIFLFVLILVNTTVFAQEVSNTPPPPAQRTIDPPPGLVVPIDKGVWILLVAGVALGGYVYFKRWSAAKSS